MNDALLKKYFEFDEADLFANRSGRLTDRQRTRLIENAKFARKIFFIAGIVIIGIIGVLPALVPWLAGGAGMTLTLRIIWTVIWVSLGTLLGVKVMGWGKTEKNGLTVHKAEGKVNIVKEESYNSVMKHTVDNYELHIGGKTFEVDSELADAVMQGDRYVFYYVEGTDDILSAERILDCKE